jgi:hypothetical protein
MAISTYAELQAAIPEWMDRDNLTTAQVQTCINLAEARLNRELNAVETDASLQGVVDERTLSLTSLRPKRVLEVFRLDGQDEIRLLPRAGGTFTISTSPGVPLIWSWEDGGLSFDCPCDQDYFFRIRYIGRFALSDSATTNALLTNHPDIYLGACLMWGGLFVEDDSKIAKWSVLVSGFITEHKALVAKQKRSEMTVSPMLLGYRRAGNTSGGTIDYVGYGDDVVYYEGD